MGVGLREKSGDLDPNDLLPHLQQSFDSYWEAEGRRFTKNLQAAANTIGKKVFLIMHHL